jgi:hypothetical protein
LESDLGRDGAGEVNRVLIMGDFNLPARAENFRSLLGPVLNYVPCLDPETSAASMLSKAGTDGDDGDCKNAKGVPGDFLYDNIIMSGELGNGRRGRGGGAVLASGVCDLVKLIDDFDMQLGGEAIEANGLQLKMKRELLKHTVSDHMPVSADLSIGTGYTLASPLRLPETHIEIVRTAGDGRFGQQYEAIALYGRRDGAKRRAAAATASDK